MAKRVTRIQLPANKLFDELTFLAKNLYNSATYLVRQKFFENGKILRYYSIWNKMRECDEYHKLKVLAGAHAPQQLLLMVNDAWQSFKTAKNDWYINPGKYRGKPKIPGYLPKNGKYIVVWSSQQARVSNGAVRIIERLMIKKFPVVPTKRLPITKENLINVRLKPFYDKFMLEIVYEKEETIIKKVVEQKVLGLDLGINNLVATSDGLIIKGGVVKSINQFFNKQLAKIQAQLNKQGLLTSKGKQ
ncbi:MAG: transposase [Candidatus Heimdallarchaeota archaeon]